MEEWGKTAVHSIQGRPLHTKTDIMHSTGHSVLRRSTEVNRGQLMSNEVNDLCRLFRILLLSKVI